MLKLKLQYFGYMKQRADSLEKTPVLSKTEGKRIRGWQRMRWFEGIIDSMDTSLSKVWEIVKDREGWCVAVHEVTESWTWLNDWTTTTMHVEKRLEGNTEMTIVWLKSSDPHAICTSEPPGSQWKTQDPRFHLQRCSKSNGVLGSLILIFFQWF